MNSLYIYILLMVLSSMDVIWNLVSLKHLPFWHSVFPFLPFVFLHGKEQFLQIVDMLLWAEELVLLLLIADDTIAWIWVLGYSIGALLGMILGYLFIRRIRDSFYHWAYRREKSVTKQVKEEKGAYFEIWISPVLLSFVSFFTSILLIPLVTISYFL